MLVKVEVCVGIRGGVDVADVTAAAVVTAAVVRGCDCGQPVHPVLLR